MKTKKLQKSALSFTLLFSLGVSSFPLTTAIHGDTQGAQTAEKKQVSLTERTSLFLHISNKVNMQRHSS
ncbi:hydrolase (plasmid) [Bacillus mycoides]|nr:hydrolase [Bacillus mycoides]